MELGVVLPTFGHLASREHLLLVAREAERLGYGSLWVSDHVLMAAGQEEPFGHIFEALTTLSYLAAVTERVRLGTSVLVLPQRNPVVVAKEVATLDVLSEGRVVLGAGVGWNEREFDALGADFRSRGPRFDEYLGVLKALWSSKAPRFDGPTIALDEVVFSPLPHQEGGPPIFLGGTGPSAFRRVATLADGWHALGLTPDAFASGMAEIGRLAEGRALSGQLRISSAAIGRMLPAVPNAAGVVLATLSGSVEEVRDALGRYEDAGVDDLVLYFPEPDAGAFVEQLHRFAEVDAAT